MPKYDFERYLNVRSAKTPSFGPDGERLSFLMDTTGVPQVWPRAGRVESPHLRDARRVHQERESLPLGTERRGVCASNVEIALEVVGWHET